MQLSKGLKYNLHYKQKNWRETLGLEAKAAINNLDITEQQYSRHAVAKTITRIRIKIRHRKFHISNAQTCNTRTYTVTSLSERSEPSEPSGIVVLNLLNGPQRSRST
jgi:hypothetical protein